MNLNGKKIVVTGGAGFIGSALAHYFDENYKDAHVLVVDKFRNDETFSNGNLKSFGHFKNLLGFKGEIYAGDINDLSTLEKIKSFAPDVIYHEAAISDTTVKEQDELIKTNVNAFVNLLDICESLGAKMIREACRNEPAQAVSLDTKMLLSGGFATSIDALAVGVTLSFTAADIYFSAAVIGIVCFALSVAAFYVGKFAGEFLEQKALILGGAILIALGFKILITHLFDHGFLSQI